jgi:hypothetical protein
MLGNWWVAYFAEIVTLSSFMLENKTQDKKKLLLLLLLS